MRPGLPPTEPASRASLTLAVAQGLAVGLLVAISASTDDAVSQWPWLLTLAVVALLWWTLRRRTRSVADRSAAALDERDLTNRNRVSWWGYATAIAGGTAVAIALIFAARGHFVDAHVLVDRAGSTLIALMLLAAVAPTTILAVTTPATNPADPSGSAR